MEASESNLEKLLAKEEACNTNETLVKIIRELKGALEEIRKQECNDTVGCHMVYTADDALALVEKLAGEMK